MDLKVKRVHPKAVLPAFAHDGDACFDITAVSRDYNVETVTYSTGLKFGIPDGYFLEVFSRSGHGFKEDIRLANSVGVVDAGYRGELLVKLTHDGGGEYVDWPRVGDRICQAKLTKLVKTTIVEVDDLDANTKRGSDGFGSTGK